MRFSSHERKDLRYLHNQYELVLSSPERKECPAKGSSARVARRAHPNNNRIHGITGLIAPGWAGLSSLELYIPLEIVGVELFCDQVDMRD